MNNGTISKVLVNQGDTPVRAFNNNGAVFRAEDIQSFTPITFYDIVANQENNFTFGDEITNSYEILAIEPDSQLNHLQPDKNILDDKPDFASKFSLTTYKNGVIKNQRVFGNSEGRVNERVAFLTPGEPFTILSDHNFKSITFWCKPCYIDAEITPRKVTSGV